MAGKWGKNGGKPDMLALSLSKCLIRAVVDHIVPLRDNACMDIGHDDQTFAGTPSAGFYGRAGDSDIVRSRDNVRGEAEFAQVKVSRGIIRLHVLSRKEM
jgi:hypothetical protein